MNLFDKEFKDSYSKYHVRTIPPYSLDPQVFYFPPTGKEPILQPIIKSQILKNIDEINSAESDYNRTRVWDYYIVGPILKENSSSDCTIIVMVEINPTNLNDILKERILQTIKQINGRLAAGTNHPIHYVPTIRKIDKDKYDAIYHPYTDKWVKKVLVVKEAKTDLEKLGSVLNKKSSKYSLKKGIKKITTV